MAKKKTMSVVKCATTVGKDVPGFLKINMYVFHGAKIPHQVDYLREIKMYGQKKECPGFELCV
jgi:hypothetical protein